MMPRLARMVPSPLSIFPAHNIGAILVGRRALADPREIARKARTPSFVRRATSRVAGLASRIHSLERFMASFPIRNVTALFAISGMIGLVPCFALAQGAHTGG